MPTSLVDFSSPKWCLNDAPHKAHEARNPSGGTSGCSGLPQSIQAGSGQCSSCMHTAHQPGACATPSRMGCECRGANESCEDGCRHRCPSCREGLVTHLLCDPQCIARNTRKLTAGHPRPAIPTPPSYEELLADRNRYRDAAEGNRIRLGHALDAQHEAEAEREALRTLVEHRARVIEGFSGASQAVEAEQRAIARSLRRDLEDHDFEFPRPEHARVAPTNGPDTITIPRPFVPFGPKGMPQDEATANYLGDVIEKIDGGYAVVGGSNVTATVRKLLVDAASALHSPESKESHV